MTEKQFRSLIGKKCSGWLSFFQWSSTMGYEKFYVDENNEIKHNRLPVIMNVFIRKTNNPHKGEATHG